MTNTNVRVLRQVEVTPPESFVEATPPELFNKLRMTPVPVLFLRQPQGRAASRWIGYCSYTEFTEFGEVTLDARLAEPAVWEPRADLIQSIYLHEVGHRFMPEGWGHNAAFGAFVLLLKLRAGKTNDFPMWHRSTLYDFHDDVERFPRAFMWAWDIAHELAVSDNSAEVCAEIITKRYEAWCTWLAGEEGRRQAKLEARQANERAIQGLRDQIKELKESRWMWAAVGFACGGLGAVMVFLR